MITLLLCNIILLRLGYMDCSAINRNFVTQHGIMKVRFPKRCIHYAFTCMVKLSFPSIEHTDIGENLFTLLLYRHSTRDLGDLV